LLLSNLWIISIVKICWNNLGFSKTRSLNINLDIHKSKVFSSEVGFRCFLKPQNCVEYGNRTREHQSGGGREGNPPPPHSFRTSFYLFAAVCVPRGFPNLSQRAFWEGSSIYNRQFLLKTGLIWLFKHGNIHYLSINYLPVSNTVSNKQILIFIICL